MILACLHVGGQACSNPATLTVDYALFLKFANRRLAALDCRSMVGIFGLFPIPDLRDGSNLHSLQFYLGLPAGVLLRAGERRHTRYHLAIPVRTVPPVVLDEQGNFDQAAFVPLRRGLA